MDFRWLPLDEGKEIWDEALGFFPEAPFSLLYGWRQVYESALRLKTFYLLAETGGRVQGLCPLVFMKSPWIGKGNFLISLPYMTRAGLWAVDSECRQAMVQRLIEKALELKADFVELRHTEDQSLPLAVCNKEHVQMLLELPEDWALYEKRIAPRLRQVRKALAAGLEIREGRSEALLRDFYRVFSRRMRELFFPVYPLDYFQRILSVFKDRCRLLLVYQGEKPLGGMLLFEYGTILSAPYVAALIQSQAFFPNQLLYYSAIRRAWEKGFRSFDFCRSQTNSGTFVFKSQWKALPRPLAYQYPLCRSAGSLPTVQQAQGSLTFRLAEKIWPHLPLPVTQWLGGRLIKQLILA